MNLPLRSPSPSSSRPPTLLFAAIAVAGALPLFAPFARASDLEPTTRKRLASEPGDFTLKVELGFASPLGEPQSQLFKTGGGETIKALWALSPYLDLGPSATFLALPLKMGPGEAGTAWTFGGSLRVKRPHHAPDVDVIHAISPWADIDALYVRTGGLNRAGLALAAGLSVPLGDARVFWIGPFVRYLEILQPDRTGYDNHDGKILSLGVSLEVGSGVRREEAPVVAGGETKTVTVDREVMVCPDRDRDDIPDKVDRCPDVAGPMDNWGCPAYHKIVVKRDKLELKEKLYFAWNQAELQEVSFPVLDEVVKALNDNKSLRVQVEGHTSSEGSDDHNQTLSEKRASAVVDYLVAHGVAKDRLTAKGFASSVPLDTNDTAARRENNPRVEFVVQFTILNDGSK
jgi:outer membrane protein OmpA-like peptidoglycan-associated protein